MGENSQRLSISRRGKAAMIIGAAGIFVLAIVVFVFPQISSMLNESAPMASKEELATFLSENSFSDINATDKDGKPPPACGGGEGQRQGCGASDSKRR